MSENMSNEDILRVLKEQFGEQKLEQILEEVFINQILNPVHAKKIRLVWVEDGKNPGVITETRTGKIINASGAIEEVEEEVIYANILDDGASLNPSGILKCQGCGSIVHASSIRRCMCGKTCCIIPGCAVYAQFSDRYYCSWFHWFLGLLGIKLRG